MLVQQFETFIFDKISDSKLPGLSAAVIQDGEITWARGFGYRSMDEGLPATPHTLYNVGSVTKSFTAAAIMQLQEQGKLNVDDLVSDYLPFPIQAPVRLWHLLTHSSGIPALASSESLIDNMIGARAHWIPLADADDLLDFMRNAGDWALAPPGERYFYLNEGYLLLGHIIEKVSGLSFADYVTEHILKPLAMTRSYFKKADVEADQEVAIPYIINADGERIASVYPYRGIEAAGGLLSNVLELGNYLRMYLNDGTWDGKQILTPASVQAMQTPRITVPLENTPFGPYGYAYGLRILPDFYGRQTVDHSGSVLVSTGYIAFIPEADIGIALLANGSGYSLASLGLYGLALLLGEDPDTLPYVQRERLLRELEGTYEAYKGTLHWQIKRSGDFIIIESPNKYRTNRTTLVPDTLTEDRRTFYTLADGVKIPVEFTVKDGKIELVYERYLLRRSGS